MKMGGETVVHLFVQQFTFGDLVPKDWFYERLGYDFQTAKAVEAFGYAKDHDFIQRELREKHNFVLHAMPDAYRVIHRAEYAEFAQRMLKNAIARAFREHAEIIEAAPVEDLTDAQLKELTDEKARASNLKLVLLPRSRVLAPVTD